MDKNINTEQLRLDEDQVKVLHYALCQNGLNKHITVAHLPGHFIARIGENGTELNSTADGRQVKGDSTYCGFHSLIGCLLIQECLIEQLKNTELIKELGLTEQSKSPEFIKNLEEEHINNILNKKVSENTTVLEGFITQFTNILNKQNDLYDNSSNNPDSTVKEIRKKLEKIHISYTDAGSKGKPELDAKQTYEKNKYQIEIILNELKKLSKTYVSIIAKKEGKDTNTIQAEISNKIQSKTKACSASGEELKNIFKEDRQEDKKGYVDKIQNIKNSVADVNRYFNINVDTCEIELNRISTQDFIKADSLLREIGSIFGLDFKEQDVKEINALQQSVQQSADDQNQRFVTVDSMHSAVFDNEGNLLQYQQIQQPGEYQEDNNEKKDVETGEENGEEENKEDKQEQTKHQESKEQKTLTEEQFKQLTDEVVNKATNDLLKQYKDEFEGRVQQHQEKNKEEKQIQNEQKPTEQQVVDQQQNEEVEEKKEDNKIAQQDNEEQQEESEEKTQKDKIDQIQSTTQSITVDVDMDNIIQQQVDNQLGQQADQQQNEEVEEKKEDNKIEQQNNEEEQKLTNQIQQPGKYQEDNNEENDVEKGEENNEENGEEENEKDKKEQIKQEQKQEQDSNEQQQQIVTSIPQSAKQETQQIEQDSNEEDNNKENNNEIEVDITTMVDLQHSKTNAKELSINFELIDKYNTTTLIDPCMNNGNQKVKVGLSTAIIRLLESKETSNEKKIDMITNIRNKFEKTESILKDMNQNKELKDKEGKPVKVSDLLLSCTELFKVLDMAEKEVEKAKQQGKDYKYNIAVLYKESLIESEKDTNKIIINKGKEEITAKDYLFGNDKQPKTDIQQERCKDLKEVKKEYGVEEEEDKKKEEQVKNYVEQDSEKQDTQQLKEENQKSKQQIDALKQVEQNLLAKQQNATPVLSN